MNLNKHFLLFLLIALLFVTSVAGGSGRNNGKGGRKGRRRGHRGVKCGSGRCRANQVCFKNGCQRPIKRKLGEQCDNKLNICWGRLRCDGYQGDWRCKKAVGRGKDCTDTTKFYCRGRMVCKENDASTQKTCKMLVGPYRPCGDKQFACRSHLECRNNICVREVTVGKWCDDLGRVCADGKVCHSEDGGRKRCKNELDLKQTNCEKPNNVCKEELFCKPGGLCSRRGTLGAACNNEELICGEPEDEKCRSRDGSLKCQKVLGLGATDCNAENTVCDEDLGLKCAANGMCTKTVSINDECSDMGGLICQDGYKCSDDGSGTGKTTCNIPARGNTYTCGVLEYKFISETEATIGGKWAGKYTFKYDPGTGKTEGTVAFKDYLTCRPYGEEDWSFADLQSPTYKSSPSKEYEGTCNIKN